MNKLFITLLLLLCINVRGQLTVTVSKPRVTGQKAVVELNMKNDLTNEVQSARAICLLLDEQGKMAGQSTKWVVGQNKTRLDPKAESKFNFVITCPQPLATSNLTAKVVFSRVILDNGPMANVQQEVVVRPAPQ